MLLWSGGHAAGDNSSARMIQNENDKRLKVAHNPISNFPQLAYYAECYGRLIEGMARNHWGCN
jgi:hypothetical protein